MTDYYLAVCTSGHLIGSEEADKVEMNQFAKDGFIMESDSDVEFDVEYDYCPNCGGGVLTKCPECQSNLQTEYNGPPYPNIDQIPSFCYSCGVSFPWITTVEAEKQRDGDFLEIDDSEINGHFYPNLVYQINLCYQVQADQAVLVLNRKLIETLIVDILRSVFGMEEIELFYDTEDNRTLPLSHLLENMKARKSELGKYGPSLDEGFFRAVNDLKHRGDASAHAIEEDPSREDLAKKSESATAVAKILFRLRTEAKTAHRKR